VAVVVESILVLGDEILGTRRVESQTASCSSLRHVTGPHLTHPNPPILPTPLFTLLGDIIQSEKPNLPFRLNNYLSE